MKIQWNRKANSNIIAPVMKEITLETKEKVPFLCFPILEDLPFIEHCFSTRHGGVSKGVYESANLSFGRSDEREAVMENYRRFAKVMHTDLEHFVCSNQTHTCNVRRVTKEDLGKGVVRPRDYDAVDGLITNIPGICLVTYYADCVPLYIVDPVNHAIGLSHSGWRGTVHKMGEATLLRMKEEFGTCAQDVKVAIGPSICRDCYEVSMDVADEFRECFAKDCDQILTKGRVCEDGEQKMQLDLWEANRILFQNAGVLPENIQITDLCTCCNSENLFSHRASNGKRGNLAAFLKIRDEKI